MGVIDKTARDLHFVVKDDSQDVIEKPNYRTEHQAINDEDFYLTL
jgi:hypothetical protein